MPNRRHELIIHINKFSKDNYCSVSESLVLIFELIISTRTFEYLSSMVMTSTLVASSETSGVVRVLEIEAWNSLNVSELRTCKLFFVTSSYCCSLEVRSVSVSWRLWYVLLIKPSNCLC